MEELMKIAPDKEKARSILRMVETTLEMINLIDKTKFPSNVAKEYYEIIRELTSIILLLDGYKAIGEKAHKRQIEYLEASYKELSKAEISLMDDLRITRNKIAYDGFFVKKSYIDRKLIEIISVIDKLKEIIKNKL